MTEAHAPDSEPRYAGNAEVQRYDDRTDLLDETPMYEAPPVSEDIHMPGPSLIPILNATGVTVALLGVTSHWSLIVAGLLIVAVTSILWVRDTVHEIAELPADHSHH